MINGRLLAVGSRYSRFFAPEILHYNSAFVPSGPLEGNDTNLGIKVMAHDLFPPLFCPKGNHVANKHKPTGWCVAGCETFLFHEHRTQWPMFAWLAAATTFFT